MDANDNNGFVTLLAKTIGAGEPTIRLLLSVFGGYVLAFIYRSFIHGRAANVQHIYFTLCGLGLCYFNFGGDVIHSVINISAIWLLLKLVPSGTALSVVVAFIFNTFYLVVGYYHVSAEEYDLSWKTPHCVLCLRLTGVVIDLYDGSKNEEKLSLDQKETALHKKPSLLELMGHTYFFGGFLVGPQFSMKRYQSFVGGKFSDTQSGNGPPLNVSLALGRMLAGVVYIATFQVVCGLFFNHQYMLTEEFMELSFLSRLFYIMMWGRFMVGKYIGIWLVAEGSCMLTGLTYNGKDINGNTLWNGCTNVKIWQFESGATFKEMIAGFNVNTNSWMVKYVMKRLKFLGNKHVSQAATLLYLAVWHGIHSGYYMNFFLEFIMLISEEQLKELLSYFPKFLHMCDKPLIKPCVWTIKKVLTLTFISYALLSFVHLNTRRWIQVYGTVYYIGHITFLLIPVICIVIKSFLKKPVKAATNGYHPVSNGVALKDKAQ